MLNILYEDNQIIVVYKERGILSQEDKTGDLDLLTMVKEYIKIKYQKPGNVYLGLVHRLDRNTSGIMVFARTSKAAKRLNEQIINHEFKKKYLAIVDGICDKKGEYQDKIYKNEKELKAYIQDNGKVACLKYQLIDIYNNTSLVEIELITGRYHQIRAQFAYHNHPLIGDSLYGNNVKKPYFLDAYYLAFNHPVSKEKMEFKLIPFDKLTNYHFDL